MYKSSRAQDEIRAVMKGQQTLYVYRDPAYNTHFGILSPFKHLAGHWMLSKEEYNANVKLSTVRIAVKHAFGHVANY